MDFAYLNAITRSTIMPPYDPWFAGGYLNYYYYGQFIIASLIRITGIVPTVAYNLAVPLIFALSAGAIYTVAYNLVAMSMRARGAIRLGNVPIMFGLIAAVLALVAANIDGLVQVATALYDSMITGGEFPAFRLLAEHADIRTRDGRQRKSPSSHFLRSCMRICMPT